jgi:tetratricopeptide (TPR) repeat protein
MKSIHFKIILSVALVLSGLLTAESSAIDRENIADQLRVAALNFEKEGEYQKAKYYWNIFQTLNPGNVADSNIKRLQLSMENKSRQHFEKGLALLRKKSINAARRQFLVALRIDPSHTEALKQLKALETSEKYIHYKVKKRDTLKKIAKKVYKDANKDFLIAYLLDLNRKMKPEPGSVLQLPVLEKKRRAVSKKRLNVSGELKKAKRHLAQKNYDKVLPITRKILNADYMNPDATELKNAAYYEKGKELVKEGKLKQAIKMFNRVESDYKDTEKIKKSVQEDIKKEAEVHYRAGVKFYIEEKLEKAIEEWKKTLELDPKHKKAKKDLKNARHLLEKLKKVE